MFKIFALCIFTLSCFAIEFNAPICDKISSEPNSMMPPQECRNYDQKEAKKAYDKVKNKKIESKGNIIKFNRDEDEKKD
jgi:hypothetical protein